MTHSAPPSAELVDSLHSLGLTKYEALVYIALISVDGATAADIHAISNVPRASVYPVLERLVQRNMVLVSHTSPRRFTAISPDSAIKGLVSAMEHEADAAQKALQTLWKKRTSVEQGREELIWSIHGREKIIGRIVDLVRATERCARIIADSSLLNKDVIDALAARVFSIKAEIITDERPEPAPPGISIRVPVPLQREENKERFFTGGIFVFDEKRVLVVIGTDDLGYTGLYSESPGFTHFFNTYRRSILQFHADEGGEFAESEITV